MSEHKYKFNVTMTCGGVKSYDVSLDTQTADITTDESLSYEQVLEKIKKTGKTVNSGEADGVPQSV
ncbi:Cytosolic copper metallochaperone [Knufia fluminis]|uniref:Cytosolic copper metallochaperone n=1 Tax=Knufia fluminis TaxID=191047 RepID=A0AAN8ETV4_9EURO|nr:Cytosolic copper metallochaperone [Knufia fluminis]